MNRTTTFALAFVLTAVSRAAHGQYPYSTYPYPYYNGGGASTVGQSYAMGMADLVRAAGDRNLNNSQASINYEQADSMDLDNQMKGEQTYFEMRKMNRSYRKAEESPGLTSEDSWRYAQMFSPKRLTSTQLDPVTGKIYWPMFFQDPRYTKYCDELNNLFVQREASHGGIGYQSYLEIQKITDTLKAELQKNINLYQPNDYISMKNFVESLAYEAKLPAV
ncbi:MAG TPA: hypothetical protein VFE46_13900 [Pirellulales bacterium]|jgi:hypothetical protein|nr:hypothetical protein [Pirellulales bacterium]